MLQRVGPTPFQLSPTLAIVDLDDDEEEPCQNKRRALETGRLMCNDDVDLVMDPPRSGKKKSTNVLLDAFFSDTHPVIQKAERL
jgi:hypothetical protein